MLKPLSAPAAAGRRPRTNRSRPLIFGFAMVRQLPLWAWLRFFSEELVDGAPAQGATKFA